MEGPTDITAQVKPYGLSIIHIGKVTFLLGESLQIVTNMATSLLKREDAFFFFFLFLYCISSDFSDLPDKQVNTLVYLYLNYRKCYLTFVFNIYKTMYIMNENVNYIK